MSKSSIIKDLEEQIKGDTFYGANLYYLDKFGSPIDLTGWDFKCQIRFGSQIGSIKFDLDLGSGLTVADPLTGLLVIDTILEPNFSVGKYYYEVKSIDNNGKTRRYVRGSFDVTQNTTE